MGAASLAAAALMAACAVAAAALFLGKGSLGRIAQGLRDERFFILLVATVLIAVRAAASMIGALVEPVASIPSSDHALQPLVLWLQQSIPHGIGVPVLGTVYVLFLVFLLVFIPVVLLAEDRELFRRYAKALILAYSISLSLHILIGSMRPGMDPASGIAPLLYDDAFWGPLSSGIMGRGSSFPSTHVTEVTVMCMATWGMGRLRVPLLVMLAAMSAAVLYLGVHWPLDVVAGVITGAGSYLAVTIIEKKSGGKGFIRLRPG